MEAIYLGFRTAKGIDLSVLKSKFGMDFSTHFSEVIAEFKKEGLIKLSESHCVLTVKGMALLDSITAAFTSQDFS
jgi:coproporphyrinogen III oxidase-like Fe-S oxidoreductase